MVSKEQQKSIQVCYQSESGKQFDDFQQGVMISDLKLFILLHCLVVFLLLRVRVELF